MGTVSRLRADKAVYDQADEDVDVRWAYANAWEWSLIVDVLSKHETAVVRELGDVMRARLTERSRAAHPSNQRAEGAS